MRKTVGRYKWWILLATLLALGLVLYFVPIVDVVTVYSSGGGDDSAP